MKRRRRSARKQRVLITGIGGNLGRAVARRLHRTCDIVGIDRRPVRHMPKDIGIETIDIREGRLPCRPGVQAAASSAAGDEDSKKRKRNDEKEGGGGMLPQH